MNIRAGSALVDSSASVEVNLPISIDSQLKVGLRINLIEADFYYKGNYDTALARSRVEGFELVATSNSSFVAVLSPADLSAAQASTAVDYLVSQCGAALNSGTWLADMHLRAKLYGLEVEFWIRDLEMPCLSIGVVQLGGPSSLPLSESCDMGEDSEDSYGKYCVSLLCAVDDLMCEKACAAEASRPASTPPPHPPTVSLPPVLTPALPTSPPPTNSSPAQPLPPVGQPPGIVIG
jgi:hypothetical protein